VTGLVSPITTAITRNKELNVAQHQADLAAVQAQGQRTADLISKGMSDDAAWELESLKRGGMFARHFELIVVTIPVVLCFLGPRYAALVKDGFSALATTPVWFQTVFVSIFMANYGIRVWRRNQSDT
jgi:hypothetical protein